MGAYSYHETKNYVCGEGGTLCINHPELQTRAEIIRDKGTNRQHFGFILALWVTSSILLTNARIRAWVSTPLHVSNLKSKADVAYVMSGGHAYWERLQAASDLYNIKAARFLMCFVKHCMILVISVTEVKRHFRLCGIKVSFNFIGRRRPKNSKVSHLNYCFCSVKFCVFVYLLKRI